jgi:hypothetical protein
MRVSNLAVKQPRACQIDCKLNVYIIEKQTPSVNLVYISDHVTYVTFASYHTLTLCILYLTLYEI